MIDDPNLTLEQRVSQSVKNFLAETPTPESIQYANLIHDLWNEIKRTATLTTDATTYELRLHALKHATLNPMQADKSDGSTVIGRAKLYLDFLIGPTDKS